MVTYAELLHKPCDDELRVYNSLVHTRQSLVNHEYHFLYDVCPDPGSLDRQAKLFARKMVTEVVHNNSLSRTQRARNIDELIERVRNTYKYSYYKTLFYIGKMYEGGHNLSYSNLGESYVFVGHCVFFNTLQKKIHRSTDLANGSTLIRRLDFYLEDYLPILEDDPIWKSSIDSDTPKDFWNSKYEFVLQDLKSNFSGVVAVANLHSTGAAYGTVPEANPLGAACYDTTMTSMNSVVGNEPSRDFISTHWNTANCVRLQSEQVLSNNSRSIYMSVNVMDVDSEVLKYQVEAITGLKIVTGLGSSGSGHRRIDDTISPDPGGDSGSSLGAAKSGSRVKSKSKPGWGSRVKQAGTSAYSTIKDAVNSPTGRDVIKQALEHHLNHHGDKATIKSITSDIMDSLSNYESVKKNVGPRVGIHTPYLSLEYDNSKSKSQIKKSDRDEL